MSSGRYKTSDHCNLQESDNGSVTEECSQPDASDQILDVLARPAPSNRTVLDSLHRKSLGDPSYTTQTVLSLESPAWLPSLPSPYCSSRHRLWGA
ncbi:protein of unknown function [Nitrospira defluvii]|uniref:Uncharacterized protein n=1 Tax=Nitrospira defluvii TaxID=330214 RepID=D8PI52_9BACT|nr:protein of unknown function [Nitrospira defluvii]